MNLLSNLRESLRKSEIFIVSLSKIDRIYWKHRAITLSRSLSVLPFDNIESSNVQFTFNPRKTFSANRSSNLCFIFLNSTISTRLSWNWFPVWLLSRRQTWQSTEALLLIISSTVGFFSPSRTFTSTWLGTIWCTTLAIRKRSIVSFSWHAVCCSSCRSSIQPKETEFTNKSPQMLARLTEFSIEAWQFSLLFSSSEINRRVANRNALRCSISESIRQKFSPIKHKGQFFIRRISTNRCRNKLLCFYLFNLIRRFRFQSVQPTNRRKQYSTEKSHESSLRIEIDIINGRKRTRLANIYPRPNGAPSLISRYIDMIFSTGM